MRNGKHELTGRPSFCGSPIVAGACLRKPHSALVPTTPPIARPRVAPGAKRPDLRNPKLATGMRTPSLPIMIG